MHGRYIGKETASFHAQEPAVLPGESPSPEVNCDIASDQACKANESSDSIASAEVASAEPQVANAPLNQLIKPSRLVFNADTEEANMPDAESSNRNKGRMQRSQSMNRN